MEIRGGMTPLQMDEEAFAILYAEAESLPNAPVNVLVGLEVMKAGFGWTNEPLASARPLPLRTTLLAFVESFMR